MPSDPLYKSSENGKNWKKGDIVIYESTVIRGDGGRMCACTGKYLDCNLLIFLWDIHPEN
jgi:hypothetical protein